MARGSRVHSSSKMCQEGSGICRDLSGFHRDSTTESAGLLTSSSTSELSSCRRSNGATYGGRRKQNNKSLRLFLVCVGPARARPCLAAGKNRFILHAAWSDAQRIKAASTRNSRLSSHQVLGMRPDPLTHHCRGLAEEAGRFIGCCMARSISLQVIPP